MKKLLVIILITVFLTPSAFAAWSYTQDFDALNDGDLQGQDSWSGDTAYDVQTSVTQGSSAKAVELATASVDITRTITSISDSGRMEIHMASDSSTDAGYIGLRDSGSFATLVGLAPDSENDVNARDGGSFVDVGDFVADTTFVKIEVDFDISADTYTVEVDDGGDSSSLAFLATQTEINQIIFQNHTNGTMYFDTFADADAAPAPAAVEPPPPVTQPVLLITKVKRFFFPNAEAAATLKWLNPEYRILRYVWKVRMYGLTTAHVKAMAESGDDYRVLKEAIGKPTMERNKVNRRLNDGNIDHDKLKTVFVATLKLMTAREFDDALTSLRSNGLMHPVLMEPTNDGILTFEEFEAAKSWLIPTGTPTSTPPDLGAKSEPIEPTPAPKPTSEKVRTTPIVFLVGAILIFGTVVYLWKRKTMK